MKIRAADLVIDILAGHGVRHVFLVTGGGAMHLNDAVGRNKNIEYITCHHEQACAMAAESYARLSGKMGVVNVTTGPGGINALNGIFGAWTDSIPVVVISGQTKRETCLASYDLPTLRQLGDQEADIIGMVKGITKYAVLVTNPKEVRYHVEKAIYIATHGRFGPTWVDIPIDIQSALLESDDLPRFDPQKEPQWLAPKIDAPSICREILRRLEKAERPVIFAGSGIRLGGALTEFWQLADDWKIPVVTAWNAHDLIWDDHPCYVGRPGTLGDRTGNFAVQNCDLLLVLGSRLNIRQISYNWKSFARAAYKIVVEIDEAELKKPTVSIDMPVHANVADILRELVRHPLKNRAPRHAEWLAWCRERRKRYPVVLEKYWKVAEPVNPYCFVEELFRQLHEDDIVVCGDGTACVTTFQAAHLKRGQRLYTNSGCASMGYDLPGAIGACLASGKHRTVCLAGDGSIQMNLQELQTILTQRLPIKIFVLNNQGYHSIRQTQRNYFPDNIVGCGVESGLDFPNLHRLADAYGYPYQHCEKHVDLSSVIAKTLHGEEPKMCEISLDLNQQFEPRILSRRLPDGTMVSPSLEDMAPFLSREELSENMLIPTEQT
jgi:acetolactate synthase-1/2/3 large subunit